MTSGLQVSVWPRADENGPPQSNVPLADILKAVRGTRVADQIARLRKLYAEDRRAYDREKKLLPAFTVSGTAKTRTEPLEHNGLVQMDFDKLNGTLDAVRGKVRQDRHVAFGYVSPSGEGLKLGVAVNVPADADAETHKRAWQAAADYFKNTYKVAADPKTKARLQLCFVSHDPEAWLNETPEPLAVPDAVELSEPKPDTSASALGAPIVLPSGDVSISAAARDIFTRIAAAQGMFYRGGALAELVDDGKASRLDLIKTEAFRSRVERLGLLVAWRSGRDGKTVLKPCTMPRDTAAALMATTEARELLPTVANVLRCPAIVPRGPQEVAILGRGYHADAGGLLVVEGETPDRLPLEEAVGHLKWLVEEFDFVSEGDLSRALAAFITPALRIGGWLNGHVPLDVAEADQSQSGKGYRHELVRALYNEEAYIITQRAGGVGSLDESFSSALIAGRPFVVFDNVRGKMASAHLEAFVTWRDLFMARVPRVPEVAVDPRRFLIQLSSNGVEATRDLANRSSIVRIRKRPGFQYRDTLAELKGSQTDFLGCVFSVVAEWHKRGQPRTDDTSHDFREWSQSLDWIVRNFFGCAPLMEGHQAAQDRAATPALSWLRQVALAVKAEDRMVEDLMAFELVELCQSHGIDIPNATDGASEDVLKRQVGLAMKKVFKDGDTAEVDGFSVHRTTVEQSREGGGHYEAKTYRFAQNV